MRLASLMLMMFVAVAAQAQTVVTRFTGCQGREPDLAVNPFNPNNVVFSEANGCNAARSVDALSGLTWTAANPGPQGLNTQMEFDANGIAYFINIETQVYRSSDSGGSFQPIGQALVAGQTLVRFPPGTPELPPGSASQGRICAPGTVAGGVPVDFPKLLASNGALYITATVQLDTNLDGTCDNWDAQAFVRSVDGGVSWTDAQVLVGVRSNPVWNLASTASGTIVFPHRALDHSCNILLTTSADQGRTWTPDRCVYHNPVGGDPDVGFMQGYYATAIDRSTGVIYIMFKGVRNWDQFITEEHLWLIKSADGGQTFGAPVKIDDGPFGVRVRRGLRWFLSVSSTGRLDAVWTDNRHSAQPETGTDGDMYYSYSTDGGQSFRPNLRLSPTTRPIDRIGFTEAGDYVSVVSVGDHAIAAWDSNDEFGFAQEFVSRVTHSTQPPTCTFAISPTSVSIGSGGGGGNVVVSTQPGCPWGVVSNATWITVTSIVGNEVNYSVGRNRSKNPRVGTLTIAGQVFTVTQASR